MKESIEEYFGKKCLVIAAIVLSIVGFTMRAICCFWGSPLQLHADEPAIVDWTIEMLQRHSWEAHFYDRPDHFEMKCDAIIFTIYSWLKYGNPAFEMFESHKMEFYILARFFTTVFGTALIPLLGIYTYKVFGFLGDGFKRIGSLISMVLTTFSPIFVQHSAYVTPDIILAFFVVLFAFEFYCYINSGSKWALYFGAIIIGIGITIKYPAAILCIPLVLMVIYRALLIDKKPLDIVRFAMTSVGLIILTVFVLAPNLITDISSVYQNIIEESRTTHLGADGLGFIGNLRLYFDIFKYDLGNVVVIPFVIGVILLTIYRQKESLSLVVGLIFWICLSTLPLHWVRWGIPMYPFAMIVVSLGICGTLQFISDRNSFGREKKIVSYAVTTVYLTIILINIILSGACIAKFSSLKDIRSVSKEYCEVHGITKENSIYEGYTPLLPGYGVPRYDCFYSENDVAKVKIDQGSKEYFVLSGSFKDRYLEQEDRYPDECSLYNAIESTYDVVYREHGESNYVINKNVFANIQQSLAYLIKKQTTTGDRITIYDLNPKRLTIQNSEGKYISPASEDAGALLEMNSIAYKWVLYINGDGKDSFLSSISGMAIEVTGGGFENGSLVGLCNPTGELEQKWEIETIDGWSYLVCENNLALTYDGEKITIEDYKRGKNQRWRLVY